MSEITDQRTIYFRSIGTPTNVGRILFEDVGHFVAMYLPQEFGQRKKDRLITVEEVKIYQSGKPSLIIFVLLPGPHLHLFNLKRATEDARKEFNCRVWLYTWYTECIRTEATYVYLKNVVAEWGREVDLVVESSLQLICELLHFLRQ